MLALDSSSPLDAAAAKATGYAAWGRYLTGEWAMSAAEVEDATAHGLGIVSIYEQSPTAALGGGRQGATDAMHACEAAEHLSQPRRTPIYAAIDFEPTTAEMPTVRAYLSSFAVTCQIHGYLAGVYGGAAVVQMMSDWLYRWQAAGWSQGVRVAGCSLYQQLTQVTVGGVTCDVDEIGTPDYGGWNSEGPKGDDVLYDYTVAVGLDGLSGTLETNLDPKRAYAPTVIDSPGPTDWTAKLAVISGHVVIRISHAGPKVKPGFEVRVRVAEAASAAVAGKA